MCPCLAPSLKLRRPTVMTPAKPLDRRSPPSDEGGWRRRVAGTTVRLASCRRPSLASVDLTAHERDGALIDLRGIPRLDGCEVGLSRLVSCPSAPAVRPQKICGRVQRIGRDVEVAGAIGQAVLRQKLRLTAFAMQ